MSTLDFVPRTLKRRKVEKPSSPQIQNSIGSSSKHETTPTASPVESKDKPPKKKQQQDVKLSWDFAFLVWLALSDYWLWADGDLRRMMETNENATRHAEAVEEGSIGSPIVNEDVTIGETGSIDGQGCKLSFLSGSILPIEV
jgi:hypothetical protein